MRDAMSGVVNVALISLFLVIVSGYLAYNISYTKAFRVKNKIIDEIERYHKCEPGGGSVGDHCDKAVGDYMDEIGYHGASTDSLSFQKLKGEGYSCNNGYCVKLEGDPDGNVDVSRKCYYKVATKVIIDIPIINNILSGMDTFTITGSSESFTCVN